MENLNVAMRPKLLLASILAFMTYRGSEGLSHQNQKWTQVTLLPGHIPVWATESSYIKPAPSTDPVNILLDIGYSSPQSVASLARAVSDPSSSQYRKYLTPAQFAKTYGPKTSVIQLATSWLTTQGLTVLYVSQNRKYIAAEGSVEVVGKAFKVEFGLFSAPNGYTLRAPLSNPSLPTILVASASRVSILGLDQHFVYRKPTPITRVKKRNFDATQARPAVNVGCVFINNQTSDPSLADGCAYTPSQLRTAYGVPNNLTGKGQTVAMVLWRYTPFVQADLDEFSAFNGIRSTKIKQIFPPFNYSKNTVFHNGPPPGFYDANQSPEISLDTQTLHGIAPDAKLIYLYAASGSDPHLISALNFVIETGLASSISNSWGGALYGPRGYLNRDGKETVNGSVAVLATYNDLFLQAVIVGTGVYFSSGDQGDGQYSPVLGNTVTPSFPAASPWVTAVGATALVFGKGTHPYKYEIPWGYQNCSANLKHCTFTGDGTGGGVANYYASPFFQASQPQVQAVLHASGFKSGRVVPDVSADGDPFTGINIVITSYVHGNSGKVTRSIYELGGTSMSCPLLVGIIACASQGAVKQPPFGFIAPTLYALKASSFNDIVPVKTTLEAVVSQVTYVLGANGGLTVLRGYDNSTGLGTPSPSFVSNLNAIYLSHHSPPPPKSHSPPPPKSHSPPPPKSHSPPPPKSRSPPPPKSRSPPPPKSHT